MQLRFATELTSEDYVKQKAWLSASLEQCPLHPEGGCGFARHTPYARVEPPGALIARWYCREGHTSFSLLPDCLAARLSSTMAEVEKVARAVEDRPGTLEETACKLRPDIEVQGAVRWVCRRVRAVTVALLALKGLRPDLFVGRQPTLEDFCSALGVEQVLPCARELAGRQVTALPAPVGLGHRRPGAVNAAGRLQHETGPDPPGREG